MVKHWRITHPELPTHPKFNIKVVGTYRDALSRQVAEAVRIELRGDEILNSKSEFNRCCLPRLTINRDDLLFRTEATTVIANPIAKDNPEGFPVEGGSFQDELGDSALWRIGKHEKAVKRKKEKEIKTDNIPGGRKRERQGWRGWRTGERRRRSARQR